jgi:hypothetical protein
MREGISSGSTNIFWEGPPAKPKISKPVALRMKVFVVSVSSNTGVRQCEFIALKQELPHEEKNMWPIPLLPSELSNHRLADERLELVRCRRSYGPHDLLVKQQLAIFVLAEAKQERRKLNKLEFTCNGARELLQSSRYLVRSTCHSTR